MLSSFSYTPKALQQACRQQDQKRRQVDPVHSPVRLDFLLLRPVRRHVVLVHIPARVQPDVDILFSISDGTLLVAVALPDPGKHRCSKIIPRLKAVHGLVSNFLLQCDPDIIRLRFPLDHRQHIVLRRAVHIIQSDGDRDDPDQDQPENYQKISQSSIPLLLRLHAIL